VTLLVATALVAAACGDDDETGGTTTQAPGTTVVAGDDTTEAPDDGGMLTASFRGVTEDSIKLGVAMVDFQRLKDAGFIDFTHGDEELSYRAVIDEINENGGVLGRRIEPVFRTFFPVGAAEGEAMCVEFTEDEQVFAVIGVIPGLFPTVIDCIAGTGETIHIGHELTAELIDRYDGLVATPDSVAERRLESLLAVLDAEGELEGRTFAVFGDQNVEAQIADTVVPLLAEYGIEPAAVGIVDTSSADSNQINATTQVLAERFRSAGVDTVLAVGLTSPAQFPAIKAVLPDVEFLSDQVASLLQNAQSSADKTPWEGTISVNAQNKDDGEQFSDPRMQDCIAIFEARQPDIPVRDPGSIGTDEPDTFSGLRNACNELEVFVRAAEAAGPNLTNESWVAGLESLGDGISLFAKTYASFGPGKYDAEDGFRLVRFSSSVGENGGFENLSDIVDTTG
jgi:hypothetical protein